VKTVTPTATGFDAVATGGNFDIYINPSNINPNQGTAGYAAAGGGCLPGDLCYNTVSNVVGGGLFLGLDLATGITADPTVTLNSSFQITNPVTGKAEFYMNVRPGAAGGVFGSNFDTNGFATPFGARDILSQNDFFPNINPVVSDWALRSNDPTRANFIPEPGSVALLAMAVLGLGVCRRRKA
jgi:hypothetical protein